MTPVDEALVSTESPVTVRLVADALLKLARPFEEKSEVDALVIRMIEPAVPDAVVKVRLVVVADDAKRLVEVAKVKSVDDAWNIPVVVSVLAAER